MVGRLSFCVQRLDLPEALDITAETFAQDARVLAGSADVVLGGASVRRIDASGIQLLYTIVAAAKARGSKVAWDSPSKTLIDAARAAGLERLLEL